MNAQTTDYERFIFLPFNRKRIEEANIRFLMQKIQENNLLQTFPVEVTKNFEIINGQHRVLACKRLGIPVVYRFTDIKPENLVDSNCGKGWNLQDYHNFYCYHKYEEYLKLDKFCLDNNLKLSVVVGLHHRKKDTKMIEFKQGKFVFNPSFTQEVIDLVNSTLDYLHKNMPGKKNFITNYRFVTALVTVMKHEDFRKDIWEKRYKQNIDRITIRARQSDYVELFQNIYNWRNEKKIYLKGQENVVI